MPTVVTAGALGLGILHHCLCGMVCGYETNAREVFAMTQNIAAQGHLLIPLSVHLIIHLSIYKSNCLYI